MNIHSAIIRDGTGLAAQPRAVGRGLVGPGDAILARPAVLDGNRAMASLLFAGPDAGALLAPVRRLLPETAGASLIREGILTARLVAPDGPALRRALVPVLEILRGAPLPKVWRL